MDVHRAAVRPRQTLLECWGTKSDKPDRLPARPYANPAGVPRATAHLPYGSCLRCKRAIRFSPGGAVDVRFKANGIGIVDVHRCYVLVQAPWPDDDN
jgi:hypothetical protein